MGGDYAPEEVVKGAVLAAQQDDVEVFLVGAAELLQNHLDKHRSTNNSAIHIIAADGFIGEDETPVAAIRHKPDSSVAVAARLVKSGEADAFVSAGSSAAAAVSAIQYIGMLEGMYRPAIVGALGSFAPNTVMVDLGANVDCKPHQFLEFAIVGSVYARKFLNISDPTIGLLSTGGEESKGSEAVREAHALFKESGLNFVGNIEGNEILSSKANVIVCDGFVGNVLLKFYESVGGHARGWTERRLRKYPLVGFSVKLLFNKLFQATRISTDTEKGGGGILWGIDGVVRIAHGASRAPHIANAIESAKNSVKVKTTESLKTELAKLNQGGKL